MQMDFSSQVLVGLIKISAQIIQAVGPPLHRFFDTICVELSNARTLDSRARVGIRAALSELGKGGLGRGNHTN